MTARFYINLPLAPGVSLGLPDAAARHVQVLRLQPGERITLFNGQGEVEGEFEATVERMGRSDVDVTVGDFRPTQREAARAVHLLVGMPANERMDWLVEKASELGVSSIQPLMTERSVLRLKADRADKKRAHWHSIATAACEQCGRNRVPLILEPTSLVQWLKSGASVPAADGVRMLLSLQAGSLPLADLLAKQLAKGARQQPPLTFLSGPEGGLSPAEEAVAMACGFAPTSLGERVLRAETAPLAVLSYLSLLPR